MKLLTLKYKQVQEIDHAATGLAARTARQGVKLSMREVARRLKLSAPYVSDLERGDRNWTEARMQAYTVALGKV